MSPSYFLTIKKMISSFLLAQLVLMHDRYKSPNFFYSKYSIFCVINKMVFFVCQQHYFDSTIADKSFTICPSLQMQLEGDAGKILHCKNTLHTPVRLEERTLNTVKAFFFAKPMFFMYKFIFWQKLLENPPIDATWKKIKCWYKFQTDFKKMP